MQEFKIAGEHKNIRMRNRERETPGMRGRGNERGCARSSSYLFLTNPLSNGRERESVREIQAGMEQ